MKELELVAESYDASKGKVISVPEIHYFGSSFSRHPDLKKKIRLFRATGCRKLNVPTPFALK